MARMRLQTFGTTLRLPSRKELEGERKCEPWGFFNREKVVSDLRLQGRLWWTMFCPTVILLGLSSWEYPPHVSPPFWYHCFDFNNRIIPDFISQYICNIAPRKPLWAHGDPEHSCIPSHTFICGHNCLPLAKGRASRTTRFYEILHWQNTYSTRWRSFFFLERLESRVKMEGGMWIKVEEEEFLQIGKSFPIWEQNPFLIPFHPGQQILQGSTWNKITGFLFYWINDTAQRGYDSCDCGPQLTRAV